MTKIDIISGFLGAGKTTLIKKLLSEALQGQQTVLIENEFGEIGIDGGFLKEAGIEIREMNSGCICCTLVGDFETSLKEVMAQYHPDRIIIEPSGVGKLSDVVRAVRVLNEDAEAQFNSAAAVVDASKARMYMKNFGEFYNDQIATAGTIILSRTASMKQDRIEKVVALIREINQTAEIITTPWEQLTGERILAVMEGEKDSLAAQLLKEVEAHHHHHGEGEECCGGHDHHHHHADEVFTSIGIETVRKYTQEEIAMKLSELSNEEVYGMVLRAKGMVASSEGEEWIHFDYVPEEMEVRTGTADVTGKIVVIGSGVKEEAVRQLFH